MNGWHRIKIVALSALVISLFKDKAVSQAPRITEYMICIGEHRDQCPQDTKAWFNCGTTYDQAAQMVCSINVDGNKKVSPYKILPQRDRSGNRCGYATA